jgi:hypothetical protein
VRIPTGPSGLTAQSAVTSSVPLHGQLACLDRPRNDVLLCENQPAVLALRSPNLLGRENPPTPRMPVVGPPSAAVLTPLPIRNQAEAGMGRHEATVRGGTIRLLPKPAHSARPVLALRAIMRGDPHWVEPLPVSAVRAMEMLASALGLSVVVPISF